MEKFADSFMQLFERGLATEHIDVKVEALKGVSTFLSTLDDEEVALKYKIAMGPLLKVVIEVLRANEAAGQTSLQSLIELTQAYGDIWEDNAQDLLFVMAEIMLNKNFEDATRLAASEIVNTLSESVATMVRK